MSQPKKIQVTKSDLNQIYHEALQAFKQDNAVELSNIEYVAACNFKAVASFLDRQGIKLDLDIEYTKRSKLQNN